MSILINLLPDVRQARLRDVHRRQTITGVAIGIWVVCGVALVLLSLYEGGQKLIISHDTRTIAQKENQLKQVPNLLNAYTAEEHLQSLSSLYGQRIYFTRFLNAYMATDPTSVTLGSMTVDSQNNLTVLGSAQTYADVAKLARALSDSNTSVGNGASPLNQPYFTNVQIGALSFASGQGVSFSITATISSEVVSNGNQ